MYVVNPRATIEKLKQRGRANKQIEEVKQNTKKY